MLGTRCRFARVRPRQLGRATPRWELVAIRSCRCRRRRLRARRRAGLGVAPAAFAVLGRRKFLFKMMTKKEILMVMKKAEETSTELLTAEEVAAFLRLNLEYFRNCFRNGKLRGFPRAVKFGSRRLWWRDEVVEWINGQREGAGDEQEAAG